MTHIILPSDFSDNAWKAMSYAANLYHNTPCKFHILNTYSLNTAYAGTGGVYIEIDPEFASKESEKQLAHLLEQFKDLDHHKLSEFETKSNYGAVIVAIQNLEEELDSTPIIIMGTRGAFGVGKYFFGTTASSAIKRCVSPVICVPKQANLGTPKSILFAMDDLIISSKNEIEPLIELAQQWDSKIATIHVAGSEKETTDKTTEEIVSEHYLNQIEHTYKTIPGDNIEDELMRFAKANEIDLIALIKRDQGFWNNFFQTSLAESMSFYSQIPLLVLKEA